MNHINIIRIFENHINHLSPMGRSGSRFPWFFMAANCKFHMFIHQQPNLKCSKVSSFWQKMENTQNAMFCTFVRHGCPIECLLLSFPQGGYTERMGMRRWWGWAGYRDRSGISRLFLPLFLRQIYIEHKGSRFLFFSGQEGKNNKSASVGLARKNLAPM
jgi:hypothetical protein